MELRWSKVLTKYEHIRAFKVELPVPIQGFHQSIGVDPGTTHLGIAVIEGYMDNPYAYLFQVDIERQDNPINRIKEAQNIMSDCVNWYHLPNYATIEGASFANNYRQVELAEVRASIALWCLSKGFETVIVPPTTLRKGVLGSGKAIPHEVWTGLPPDAVQALVCAYFPLLVYPVG
jgi:Holliday junction resolvasome RuvABC endonuclease subunit